MNKKNNIERAIIMAAGMGKRMKPVTNKIPKPLVSVKGKIIIEDTIEKLDKNGIGEIFIVVGYMKEKFQYLVDKYESVKIIENPFYNEYNNISSLYVARHYIENSIILDGDQIIVNEALLDRSFKNPGYCATWIDFPTKEWILDIDERGKINFCNRDGSDEGWRLFSLSKWNEEEGKKLRELLVREFENKKRRDIYWDDVPLVLYLDEFQLYIKKVKEGDIIEIDTFEELCEMDESYRNF